MNIATIEPVQAAAGDTWQWTKQFVDYPATDGWSLTYYIKGNTNSTTINATVSGGLFSITVAATTTATLVAGTSYLSGYVTKGTERHAVYNSTIIITPNVATATGSYDGSSNAQKILAAIDAVLANKATEDQKVLMHDNVRLETMSWDELIKARNYWNNIVLQEKAKENAMNGKGVTNLIRIGFRG